MARRSRRRFLQVSLAGLTAVLAGCGMPGGEGEENGGEDEANGGEEGGEEGEDEGGEEGEDEGGGEEERDEGDDRAAPTGPGS